MARRPPLEGIPGREADAAQRGFFYQALVAALAWVRLRPNEELLIESPEDLTVAADGAADLRQVKDRTDTLTLNGVIGWLGTVVQLQARNPDYELTFAYISTSTIGLERAKKDQPNGNAGLDEWNAVKAGQPPAALVAVLRRLAARDRDLAAFLSQRTDEQVVTELVSRVTWAVAAPRVAQIEQELAEALAKGAVGAPSVAHLVVLGDGQPSWRCLPRDDALQSCLRLEIPGQPLHLRCVLAAHHEGEGGLGRVPVEQQRGVSSLEKRAVLGGGNSLEAFLLGQRRHNVRAMASCDIGGLR